MPFVKLLHVYYSDICVTKNAVIYRPNSVRLRCALLQILVRMLFIKVVIYLNNQFIPSLLSDIDECGIGSDNCDVNAVCANTYGSFTCTCRFGLSGDGVTCNGKTH